MFFSEVQAFAICLKRKPPSEACVASWKDTFPTVQIVDAVDASTLSIEDDTRVHDLVRSQIRNPDIAADSVFAMPSIGAIGCALSHYALLRKCEKSGMPMIILEQDVCFDDEAVRTMRSLRVPPAADFVSLLYIRQSDTAPYDATFDRIVGPHCDGNQCYYVTPRGATMILNKAFPIVTQNDLLVGVVANTEPTFVALALRKRLYSMVDVFMDNLDSSIQHFRIKKYLPRSNIFYYAIALIVLLLFIAYLF